MSDNGKSPSDSGHLTRRDFIKTGAFLGGTTLAAAQVPWLFRTLDGSPGQEIAPTHQFELALPENQIYTVCLQCNTGCPVKVKIQDGVAIKVDANPYGPWGMMPHLPYSTSPLDVATVEGYICPKGQAGIQSVYDPYRIRRVLKRAGPRGSGRWQSIAFEQAIDEIVSGGKLFADVAGEENREVTGLKDIWALRDPDVAKALSGDLSDIAGKKTPEEKRAAVEEFKRKHADDLHLLIDPDHPDLGPKNNQFVFMWGRLKGGRSELISRFTKDSFGSTNAHGHTTVCQGSLYFTGKAMSEQYQLDEKAAKMKWTGGQKFYWQADAQGSEFIIFVGASPFEANYGPPRRGHSITDGLVSGRLKYVVVDPRLSKTAAKASKWLPIKPGAEAALALAMIRWIIDNERYDVSYLANANKAAAATDGEPTWCNASWLVKIEDGEPGAFLRASDLGLTKESRTKETADKKIVEYEFDPFVVLKDGQPVTFDPYDEETAVEGDLLVDTEMQGIKVKSGLQVLKESAAEHSIEEWAEICGLKASDIEEVAQEFTSHGKKAAADIHRGVSQHTNGFYNVLAWFSLNLLIGNYDWKGGMVKLSTYDQAGSKEGKPFNVGKLHPKKLSPFGTSLIRHEAKYEESTLFDNYPAKRPWFPFSSDIYQEIVPSAGDAYPYPIKALFLYMGTPVYSLPAGNTNIEILADVNKVPLFVASDIVIGETSMYADYIFPDLSYLERWEFGGSHPSVVWKVQPTRNPAIAPIPETVTVFGKEMPVSLEAMLMGLAEKLGLPGFGPGGFGEGKDFTHFDDLYLPMVANVAFGEKADGSDAVPDAADDELQLFLESRRHLPTSVFDAARWQAAVGDEHWRRAVHVLNRGGRFEDFAKAYDGEQVKNKYGTLINLYQEKTATAKNSMTGQHYAGVARYFPAPADSRGQPVADDGFDLRLITYREISHTKSRTVADYWLLGLRPENFILVNKRDAERLGLEDDDLVRVISASNSEGVWDLKNGHRKPMEGKVKTIEGLRPGVVAFSLGHGHFAYGASDVVVDGETVKADERRAKGVHGNAAMRVDPYLGNTCLSDITGGSAVFYDTQVKLVKA
jgi:anaerobic selenocysteine-containing dehydrogenase